MSSTEPTSDEDVYLVDTTSTARTPGVRDLVMTDRWNTPIERPNGGYVLAAMLRGTGDELGVPHDPLYAAISYLGPPSVGPATIEVEPVKQGRRVVTASTRLLQDGRLVAVMTSGFGPREDERTTELGSPPALPAPDQCLDPSDHGGPTGGLFDRVDHRFATVPGWSTGAPSGDPAHDLWQRLAGGRTIDAYALGFLVDSAPPPVMELGEMASMTVQLTVHFHRRPTPGWIATRLSTRHLVTGFHEEDCELWDESGRLVAQSRQLAILG